MTVSDGSTDAGRADLLERIHARSAVLDQYLKHTGRRRNRLSNLSIVGGSVAAALTAAPAFGGSTFTGWLSTTFHLSAPAWQILCALAAVCSVAATVATQLHKSNNYDGKILEAQAVRANLEIIDVSLSSGVITPEEGTSQFLQTLQKTAFIDTT